MKNKLISLLLMAAVSISLQAQQRSAYFDQPADIVLPSGYRQSGKYPLIVFLPYTTGTAGAQARSFGVVPGEQSDYIVLLPKGTFYRDDYLPNFTQFVEWVDERLQQDLRYAMENYAVDVERMYLAGYSLGGDLSWALSQKNPGMFAGAVMAGTRASYPATQGTVRQLADSGYRAAFIIGSQETPERKQGIERAHETLTAAQIETMFRTYQGGHQIPPRDLLGESLQFISRSSIQSAGSIGTAQGTMGRSAQGSGPSSFPPIVAAVLTRDPGQHVGLRYDPWFDISGDGFGRSYEHSFQIRAEGQFDDIYLRTITTLESLELTKSYRQQAFSQHIALAYGYNVMWGAGISWDWFRRFSAGEEILSEAGVDPSDIARNFQLSAFWIHPRRMRGLPASVLELRYTIPHGFSPFSAVHVFNADVRYHLHVTDWLKLKGGLASYTVQNSPYIAEAEDMRQSLDHVLQWRAGVGIRVPGPWRWEIQHTGRRVQPLDSDPLPYRAVWGIALEYLL
ncbi:dienelactone hydrolase family protein [Spirochaeta dissipatitropha]